jgi:predicted nucleotidyltransferase
MDQSRRAVAIKLTRELVGQLAAMGVTAKIFGSLASDRFSAHSDIDLLVTDCPRDFKYRIEGIVEDSLPGFKFDVVYLDEIPPYKLHRFTEGTVDASDLHGHLRHIPIGSKITGSRQKSEIRAILSN